MSEITPLSQDVVQTADSARQVERVAQAAALAGALTPTEVVKIDASARNQLYEHHKNSGKPLPDSSALQRAGADAVKAIRAAKAGPAISEIKAATPAPATPAPATPAPAAAPSQSQTIHGQRVHAPEVTALVDRLTAAYRALTPEAAKAYGGAAAYENELKEIYAGTHKHLVSARGQTESEAVAAARAMVAAADAEVQPSQVPAEHLHGYSLAAVPVGVTITDVPEMSRMLRRARAIGLTQAQVNAAIIAETNQ